MAALTTSTTTLPEQESTITTSVLPTMERLSLSTSVEDLRKNQDLWYKLHVFLYDLRNLREIKESHDRLDKIADASYIGLPYFSAHEAQTLKSTLITPPKPKNYAGKKATAEKSAIQKVLVEGVEEDVGDGKTLEMLIEEELNERLERRLNKRQASGDFRVCAAHDLAPILEKAFDIDPKQLSKEKTFLNLMARSRLKLKEGDEWKGLPKKSFGKKGAKR
ncbi:uncharacterized protein RSE6_12850 [Rhynchosporium secalis]|uniref:Uncharacterized protein n=1 Tax=Rhynchosporium secalis TaxID=38038 RepID=A0A1E1MRI3_RHYSE|nr:uncharacterized protein RSE6_12850 [Rhynchosporium secalis]